MPELAWTGRLPLARTDANVRPPRFIKDKLILPYLDTDLKFYDRGRGLGEAAQHLS